MTFKAPLEVVLTVILVEKMKEIVITMENAKKGTSVELTIVEVFWALNLLMIVATKKMFAQLKILVDNIEVIVILIWSVWMDLSVD